MKKGQEWLERILHGCIIMTGFYIIYRGTGILAETECLKKIFCTQETAEVFQEVTLETYLPGYLAVFEQISETDQMDQWLDWFVPVLREWYEAEIQSLQGLKENTEKQSEEGSEEFTGKESDASEEDLSERMSESLETERKEILEETEELQQTISEKETDSEEDAKETLSKAAQRKQVKFPTELGMEFEDLLKHYFIVDTDTRADALLLDEEKLLQTDLSLQKDREVPQILIYHTHSQEFFVDSQEENAETGIIGIGAYLETLLEENYGYNVIHDTSIYDWIDGVLDRSAAYDRAREGILELLEQYPTIEVIIDLHRDGVEGQHFVTEINGKQTARIMFFNGLSRDRSGQLVEYLQNPYIEQNLAFSFQMQLAAQQLYPGYTRNIYLKGQRFNLHLKPRSLLIEAGTQLNTIEEEKNAMEPLANLLDQVLQSGED